MDQMLKGKWEKLLKELNEIENVYDLHLHNKNVLQIIRKSKEFDEVYCKIYRKEINYDIWYQGTGNYYLRIQTNNYRINNDRLKKDFDGKEVAANLHKQCNILIEKLEEIEKSKKIENDLFENMNEQILKRFNVTGKRDKIKDGIVFNYGPFQILFQKDQLLRIIAVERTFTWDQIKDLDEAINITTRDT